MQDNRFTPGDISPDQYLAGLYFLTAVGLALRPEHRITELMQQLFGWPALTFAYLVALGLAATGLAVLWYKPSGRSLTHAALPFGLWCMFTILTIVFNPASSLSTAAMLFFGLLWVMAYTDVKAQNETAISIIQELKRENLKLKAELDRQKEKRDA